MEILLLLLVVWLIYLLFRKEGKIQNYKKINELRARKEDWLLTREKK